MSVADLEDQVTDLVTAGVRERLRGLSDEDAARLNPAELAAAMLNAMPQANSLADVGPFYDTAGLVRWLDVTRQALHQRIAKRRLLAARTTSGQTVYPAWQFRPDGRIVDGLPAVLNVLLAQADPWTVAVWLTTPTPALDGEAAIDVLKASDRERRVLALARTDAARWSR